MFRRANTERWGRSRAVAVSDGAPFLAPFLPAFSSIGDGKLRRQRWSRYEGRHVDGLSASGQLLRVVLALPPLLANRIVQRCRHDALRARDSISPSACLACTDSDPERSST